MDNVITRIEPLPMSFEFFIPDEGHFSYELTEHAELPIPYSSVKIGDFELCDHGEIINWPDLVSIVDSSGYLEPFISGCGCDDCLYYQTHFTINHYEGLIYFSMSSPHLGYQIFSVNYDDFMKTVNLIFDHALAVFEVKLVRTCEGELIIDCNLMNVENSRPDEFVEAYNKFKSHYTSYIEHNNFDNSKQSPFRYGYRSTLYLPNELPFELRPENEFEREERIKQEKADEEEKRKQVECWSCISQIEAYICSNRQKFPDDAMTLWEGSTNLEFDYTNSEHVKTHRIVDVKKILRYKGQLYLVGICQTRKEERFFRFDRTSLTNAQISFSDNPV